MGELGILDGRTAATAVSNLLGVWVPHHATLDAGRLAELIDRAGGREPGRTDARGGRRRWPRPGRRGTREWASVLGAVLDAVAWAPTDLPEADSPTAVAEILNAAPGGEDGGPADRGWSRSASPARTPRSSGPW
ncbi:MAG: hypothetical protein KatS3mg014_2659 [Actinomycetota bacterium]|nr:MAG: hypothetical protein KatS3mg014_2659 [Actinomycetota bacterium]